MTSRIAVLPVATLLAMLLTGCDSFDPASVVQSLRVLGIKAEPPEIPSGAHSTLTPLVVDLGPVYDAGTIDYEWALCTKIPAVGVDVDPDCFDSDDPAIMTPLPTLAGGSTVVTMPERTLAQLGSPDSTGGFYVPFRLRVHAGNAEVVAFERLRWQAGFVPPNNNPTLSSISYVPTGTDGDLPDMGQAVDLTALPDDAMPPIELPRGGKLRFRATDAPGSGEAYTTFTGDPRNLMTINVTELVRFFWYTSAGKVNNEITGEARPDTVLDTTAFMDTLATRDGMVDVWLVAREERGGTDFIHRRIHVK